MHGFANHFSGVRVALIGGLCALVLAILLPAIAFSNDLPSTPPENLVFSHILPNQVEVLGHINTLAMDAQGFMWFGAASGLARFDGYQLKLFHRVRNDSRDLADIAVHQLMVDAAGSLWAASEAGLYQYHPESEDFMLYSYQGDTVAARKLAHNSVRALWQDHQGNIWLGTSGGLLRFEPPTKRFTDYPFADQLPSGSGNTTVWDIAADAEGFLWLGLQTDGVARFDPRSSTFDFFPPDPRNPGSLKDADVRSVHVDRQNRVWLGTYSGDLYQWQPQPPSQPLSQQQQQHQQQQQQQQQHFRRFLHAPGVRRDVVWAIWQDRQNRVWTGDGGGLNLVDETTGTLTRFGYEENNPAGPGNHAVRALYEDRAGDLWLGYFPSGVDRIDWQAAAFRNFRHSPDNPRTLTDGGVLSGLEDEQGHLWIGTGFGLSRFDPASGDVQRYFHEPQNPHTLAGNTSISLLLDRQDGGLWVGSWSKGLNRLDRATGDVVRYRYDPADPSSLLGQEPWALLQDRAGDIWIASELGVSRYNRSSDNFTRYLPDPAQMGGDARLYTRALLEDSRGHLWVGSDRGLFLLDRDSGQFTSYRHVPGDANSLGADLVLVIFEDSRHNLWLGTHGGGLNLLDRETGQFRRFGEEQGLASNVVTSIAEDRRGNLWLTTHHGLARMDAHSGTFRHFDRRHGLLDNLFNRNTAFFTRTGELFFGSTKGFTLFNPDDLRENRYVPPLAITDFKIFNHSLEPGVDEGLPRAISLVEELTLGPGQSVFSLEFAALSFHLAEQNQYAYRLVGFDRDWHQVGIAHSATYTNLDPGQYTFEVKAANSDGIWSGAVKSLRIRVEPPFWQTWWAYGIYLAALLALGRFLLHLKLKRVELNQQRQLNQRLRKLDKIKDSFLANTSHELRTPLNGMIGMAESLLDDRDLNLPEAALRKLRMIRSSGKRLANLVNDILDYAKLTERSLDLRPRPVKLHAVAHEVLCLLQPLGEAKGLELRNRISDENLWVMADENRLQQILVNLVGNAIKFTDSGHITLSAEDEDGRVRVRVTDTGVGIRSEDIHSVFIAFHQLEDDTDHAAAGTGLGLAISKQLVELQGGEIAVESEYGHGSCFSFTLQRAQLQDNLQWHERQKRRGGAEILPMVAHKKTGAAPRDPAPEKLPGALLPMLDQPENYTVLVVDDDPVNRMVLTGILQQHRYGLLEAANGFEALNLLQTQARIDLVILDVMMPRLSGFEVCARIRESHPIDQLPILFLTAQKVDEDLQRGFAVGGNEFLLKPVSKYELLALVANHLRLMTIQRNLRAKVTNQ